LLPHTPITLTRNTPGVSRSVALPRPSAMGI
jgi:hypothetical protein